MRGQRYWRCCAWSRRWRRSSGRLTTRTAMLRSGRRIVSRTTRQGVSRFGGQAGPRPQTLCPRQVKTTQAGPGSEDYLHPPCNSVPANSRADGACAAHRTSGSGHAVGGVAPPSRHYACAIKGQGRSGSGWPTTKQPAALSSMIELSASHWTAWRLARTSRNAYHAVSRSGYASWSSSLNRRRRLCPGWPAPACARRVHW